MSRKLCFTIMLAALTVFPAFLHARDAGTHPRIGLVLSGGGARGAAHVGVIKVLEEMRVPIYCIVGTSMGSIVGGLYASGTPTGELEDIAVKTDWDGLFSDRIPRREVSYRYKTDWPNYITRVTIDREKFIDIPQGLIKGKRLDLMLRSLTLNAPKNFDDFPISFRAIASDIETGKPVVLSKGDLARSLRASMAIPGAFAPVEIDGKLLVDGGVSNNMAIDVAKDMGADVVIAVNIGTPLSTRKDLENVLGIIDQLTGILTVRNVEAQIKILGPNDKLLTPELGTITTASFNRMDKAIEIGWETADSARPFLSAYSMDPSEYQAFRSRQLAKASPTGKIEFVKTDQTSLPGSTILLDMITKGADKVLNKDVMSYQIFELYKRGDFEDIDFALVEEGGKKGLLIKTTRRKESRNVVDLGLELIGTAQKDNSFRVVTRYTADNLNRMGAEWKNELWLGQNSRFYSEFYQPLNPSPWRFFAAPNVEYQNYPVEVYKKYTDRDAIAKYRIKVADAGLDIGLQMGEYGEARFGYVRGKTRSGLETGIPELPEQDLDDGAFKVTLKLDQLDSPFFPTQGGSLAVRYLYGRESLGDSEDYTSIDTTLAKAFSYDRHTVILRGRWATDFDSTAVVARGFFLGGLFNLSGLNTYQVHGGTLGLGEAVYLLRLKKLSPLVGGNMYAGASFEAGNAWDDRSDAGTGDLIYAGSIFLGIESNIGPIYFGIGHAEGGQTAVYFSLGAKQY